MFISTHVAVYSFVSSSIITLQLPQISLQFLKFFLISSCFQGMSEASKRVVEFLDKSGYPQLPLKISQNEVQNFFTSFQNDISENCRVVVQSSVLPVNESPEKLAQVMTGKYLSLSFHSK